MNARFRIGNVYNFKMLDRNTAYISERPLVYVGYSHGYFNFRFKGAISGVSQICPKDWLENKPLVEVTTEWDKQRKGA